MTNSARVMAIASIGLSALLMACAQPGMDPLPVASAAGGVGVAGALGGVSAGARSGGSGGALGEQPVHSGQLEVGPVSPTVPELPVSLSIASARDVITSVTARLSDGRAFTFDVIP